VVQFVSTSVTAVKIDSRPSSQTSNECSIV
jgi:hypothetical protein